MILLSRRIGGYEGSSNGVYELKTISTVYDSPLGPIAFAASLQLGFSCLNFVMCVIPYQTRADQADSRLRTAAK